mmetsp:Transcript_15949/g.52339  ORF Transcript_15949/g.52339 Transcript_15949/m.52339 type:complete len:517 (-) Transcript_15949:81-1631(-)
MARTTRSSRSSGRPAPPPPPGGGGGRVDPTTVTTASFVPSADGQSILGVLPEKAGRFSTGDGKRRDDTASGTTVESVVKPPRPIPREATSGAQTSTETTSTHPHPFLPKPHSEYGGDVVKWGSTFLVDSERACHDACVAHVNDEPIGCNVWVYCPSIDGCGNDQPHKACWLKHQSRPENPVGQIDDPHNKWTSGSMSTPSDTRGERGVHKKFHVVVTTNANVYQAWQVRVMYYWYLKMKEAQGPDGQMGGFTRVLHDDKDALVDEIPTCVVDRLDNEYGFVVLSRPNAFVEFFKKCGDIEEDYILMAEPDHLYLKPLENLMTGNTPAAFPFFYIDPKKFPKLIRRFAGEHLTDSEIEQMDPIGSSPVFIHKKDLATIAPIWRDVTLKIKQDKEADKEWGWVLEMYGYTIAAKIAGVRHDLRPQLQAQPPWDKSIGEFFILHFTYGNDYDLNGKFTPGKIGQWRFDKRTWMSSIPPKNLPLPPAGCDNELVKRLVEMVNEASANLPNWENPLGVGRG